MAKINRNAPCPCGSGKKYKKCCLNKDEEARQAQLAAERGAQETAFAPLWPLDTVTKPIPTATEAGDDLEVEQSMAEWEDGDDELATVWEEFEAGQTPEARFAMACDRMQGFLQNVLSGGQAWREHGVTRADTLPRMTPAMEVDQAFIAAILTIIGYSINDTVVIFDRIREYVGLHPKTSLQDNMNNALLSTLGRTINASGTTLVVMIAIFIFGGEVIRGFAFALMIGIFVGTYSSIFTASPIAFDFIRMQQRKHERKLIAKGLLRKKL
jgi:hypothetical protein